MLFSLYSCLIFLRLLIITAETAFHIIKIILTIDTILTLLLFLHIFHRQIFQYNIPPRKPRLKILRPSPLKFFNFHINQLFFLLSPVRFYLPPIIINLFTHPARIYPQYFFPTELPLNLTGTSTNITNYHIYPPFFLTSLLYQKFPRKSTPLKNYKNYYIIYISKDKNTQRKAVVPYDKH